MSLEGGREGREGREGKGGDGRGGEGRGGGEEGGREEGGEGGRGVMTVIHILMAPQYLRGRSQLSTFMKACTAYARGEGVWDHRTLFP